MWIVIRAVVIFNLMWTGSEVIGIGVNETQGEESVTEIGENVVFRVNFLIKNSFFGSTFYELISVWFTCNLGN